MAIFSAQAAYQIYRELFEGERFRKLKALGARTQRLLWASTSTKNPAYDELKYIEALIGPHTINTVPSETLTAYREHGKPAVHLEADTAQSGRHLGSLKRIGH